MLAISFIFIFTGCKWEQQRYEPYRVETREVTDENGTYTAVYRYYDATSRKGVDPDLYKILVMTGFVFSILGAYVLYRLKEMNRLKNRCSVPVTATVISIRSSAHWDRFIRFRRKMNNATYRYDYEGLTFEGSNEYYGSRSFIFGDEKPGDIVTVMLDPVSPNTVYDLYAKRLRDYFLIRTVMFFVLAAASFISYFVI